MAERDVAQAQDQDQAFRAYVQEAAHGNGTADDLAKLYDLRDRGVITDADFQQGKEKILQVSSLTCPRRMAPAGGRRRRQCRPRPPVSGRGRDRPHH